MVQYWFPVCLPVGAGIGGIFTTQCGICFHSVGTDGALYISAGFVFLFHGTRLGAAITHCIIFFFLHFSLSF